MSEQNMAKPTDIKPPFDLEKALAKVQTAEDARNSRAPERVFLVYTENAERRNVTETSFGNLMKRV